MQDQNQDTIVISTAAAQLFVALLDAHDHSIIKGRDARGVSNEIEAQLQQLQAKKNEDAKKVIEAELEASKASVQLAK